MRLHHAETTSYLYPELAVDSLFVMCPNILASSFEIKATFALALDKLQRKFAHVKV